MAKDLKQKALMYVFGKKVNSIVDVREETDAYSVRYEDPKLSGVYHISFFSKSTNTEQEINHALVSLSWIAEGNEFPT
jgi:hypothetical protein